MNAIRKLALFFVGGHLLLGLILLSIEATHGINDQDASFAIALLFHYLNAPTVWLLRSLGGTPAIILVLLVGIVQWVGLALAIGAVHHAFTSRFRGTAGQVTKTAEPTAQADAQSRR